MSSQTEESIEESKSKLNKDPLMSFAVNVSFVRLAIESGKASYTQI